jgi:hypothetical protein
MFDSLIWRLTLIYLATSAVLTVILLIAGAIAEIETFRLDANGSLNPAFAQALRVYAD